MYFEKPSKTDSYWNDKKELEDPVAACVESPPAWCVLFSLPYSLVLSTFIPTARATRSALSAAGTPISTPYTEHKHHTAKWNRNAKHNNWKLELDTGPARNCQKDTNSSVILLIKSVRGLSTFVGCSKDDISNRPTMVKQHTSDFPAFRMLQYSALDNDQLGAQIFFKYIYYDPLHVHVSSKILLIKNSYWISVQYAESCKKLEYNTFGYNCTVYNLCMMWTQKLNIYIFCVCACVCVSLTVHLSKTSDNDQINIQIFNTFITILYMYMFRAISCSSKTRCIEFPFNMRSPTRN